MGKRKGKADVERRLAALERSLASAAAAAPREAPEEEPEEDIAGWRRKGRPVGKAASVLLTVQLVALALLAALCWGPVLAGWQTYGVVSDSMAPSMWRNDLAFVDRSVAPGDLSVGDVAAFHLGNGKVCGHRVVSIDREARTIQTKGDAVELQDAAPVPFEKVFGETKGSIALLGGPLMFYQEHKLACVVVLVAIAAALFALTLVFPPKPKLREEEPAPEEEALSPAGGWDEEPAAA